MDIGERIVMHRLLEVDRVEDFDVIAEVQQGIAALDHDAAFRVSNYK